MKIQDLDIKTIENIALFYHLINDKFNDFELQKPKKINRIRKWINKHLEYTDIPKETIESLKSSTDDDFVFLFKSCHDYIETNGTALEQKINSICKELPKDANEAILTLFRNEYYINSDFKKANNNIEIIVEKTATHKETLILIDAVFSTENFDTLVFFEDISMISNENNLYNITAKGELYEKEESFDVDITFSSAKTECEVFNPVKELLCLSPWDQLSSLSIEIIGKEKLNCNLNNYEEKLLPLLKELANLTFVFDKNKSFPILKSLFEKFNYLELLSLIERIENPEITTQKVRFLASKLTNKLNNIKYKPLWQEIYNLICESQKDYPTYCETQNSEAVIVKFRNDVTKAMNEYGYYGEYPLFQKNGTIKGLHTIDSYDTSYTIGLNNNTVHYIMCDENYDNDTGIYLDFVCANEQLKRNESPTDFHSCLFNCKGKKFFDYITFDCDYNDEQKNLTLGERISIAVKSVEFKKLNKSERSKLFSTYWSFKEKLITFLLAFIFCGFLFATVFTPAMMGFSIFMLWLYNMPIIISDIPWLITYFFSWALFGIPMGLLTILKK